MHWNWMRVQYITVRQIWVCSHSLILCLFLHVPLKITKNSLLFFKKTDQAMWMLTYSCSSSLDLSEVFIRKVMVHESWNKIINTFDPKYWWTWNNGIAGAIASHNLALFIHWNTEKEVPLHVSFVSKSIHHRGCNESNVTQCPWFV